MEQRRLRLLLFFGGCIFALFSAFVLLSSEEAQRREALLSEDAQYRPVPFSERETVSEYPDTESVPAPVDEYFKPGEGMLASVAAKLSGSEENVPEGPYVAIVIDDFGFSRIMAEEYEKLNMPVTWAIIPFQRFSSFAAERANESGIPYIVHLPMGAREDPRWTGSRPVDRVDSGMSREDISLFLRGIMESLPDAVGLNNHRGSRATSDEQLMDSFMEILGDYPLFFLDSRTSSSSVAYRTAVEKGIPALYNSVFLDHEPTEEFMEAQFRRGTAIAEKRGWVVMIAHTKNTTLNFLRKRIEAPLERGTLVTLPDLVRFLHMR